MPGNGQFKIGIDTGGTYTDAVVYCPTTETVVAKTKVPTTHGDLGVCVTNALTDALGASGPTVIEAVVDAGHYSDTVFD